MPDISMCINSECPKRMGCYRFMAVPTSPVQTYTEFQVPEGQDRCEFFMKIARQAVGGGARVTDRWPANELVLCAKREVAQRERVYPGLVGKGSMSQGLADCELRKMGQIAVVLEAAGVVMKEARRLDGDEVAERFPDLHHALQQLGFVLPEAEQAANGANARTVWTIATKPCREAHFATFPPDLPKRCILAGCPLDGTVLDPFAGTGTTLAVAINLGRQAVGIEINPEYCKIARAKIADTQPALDGGDWRYGNEDVEPGRAGTGREEDE